MSFPVPITLIVFNRPDLTQRVFQAVARVKPQTLFVISDGARHDRDGEAELIDQSRDVIGQVDWPCQVFTDYSEVNLGCKQRIASGLDWVFGQTERSIVLEDDCLPEPTFFSFCERLLTRYQDDQRIMAISGNNFQQGRSRTPHSYYFSKFPHCWGWATWRRAWQKFDLRLSSWPDFQRCDGLQLMSDHPREAAYWSKIFERQRQEQTSSWAYAWLYSMWAESGLAILPDVNLVTNIGFDDRATHTTGTDNLLANLPTSPIEQLIHPPRITRNREADRFTFETIFRQRRMWEKLSGRWSKRWPQKRAAA